MTVFTLLAALLLPAHAAEITISPVTRAVANMGFVMWGDPAWSTDDDGTVLVAQNGLTVSSDGYSSSAGYVYYPITFISGRKITGFTICYTTVDEADDFVSFELSESDLEVSVLHADPLWSRSSAAGQCDTVALDVLVTKSLTMTVRYLVTNEATIHSISLTTSK